MKRKIIKKNKSWEEKILDNFFNVRKPLQLFIFPAILASLPFIALVFQYLGIFLGIVSIVAVPLFVWFIIIIMLYFYCGGNLHDLFTDEKPRRKK